MKLNTNIVFLLILVFHILMTIQCFYTQFSDFTAWTIYDWRPFCYVLFTILWFGAYKKRYTWGFAYIGAVMVEFLLYAVFREEYWAPIFGRVLFPIDLIFTAVLLLLFKKHFGVLQRPNWIQNQSKEDA